VTLPEVPAVLDVPAAVDRYRSRPFPSTIGLGGQGLSIGEDQAVGEDNILFETDFPHPTCLYPKPLETVAAKMATLPVETQRKIYGENARTLYRL
jgi:predicted TIM-barrel fold metal-dependent hydrolase